ncbi:MAG: PorT family protein [Flavobacteriales bacterium]|nr:PorT family protein [Flavobacteriales bacterium]
MIKKYISFLGIILVLTLSVLAQEQNQSTDKPQKNKFNARLINFGIKVGFNINRLDTRIPNYLNETYVGFNGGLFARFNFQRIYLQPEVLFSMIGGNGFFENGGSYDLHIHEIEFPVAIGYKVLDFKIINFRLNFGPFAAVSVYRDIKVTDPFHPENYFMSDKLSKWNAGIFVGIGADIWRFNVNARYKFGFVNLLGDNVMVQDPGAAFKNGHFEISVGFKIF